MEIEEIKKKMKSYIDFFGGKIIGFEKIDKATTKTELYNLLDEHLDFINDMHSDALGNFGRFRGKLDLLIEPEEED